MQKSTRCVTIPSEAVETICQDDNAVKLSSVVCWLIVVSAAVSVLLSPSRFASQSIEWTHVERRRAERNCADKQGSLASKITPNTPSKASNLTSDVVTARAALGWSSDKAGADQKEVQLRAAFRVAFFFAFFCAVFCPLVSREASAP